MKDAVYLAMVGVVPSIEAAFEMDGVMRSAAIMVAREVEERRQQEMVLAVGLMMGTR